MLKNPKSCAYLVLSTSNLEPSEINDTLKIHPDFFGTVDENGTTKTIWQLNSNLSPEEELESHVVALLKKIAPVRNEFKELNEKHIATLYCSIEYSDESKKALQLSSRSLTLIGNLGVNIEVTQWDNHKLSGAGISII
ncbi:MAG TPA: DUF4279 domain-containing protein [Leptospiraceae bacterium]|nr:DUF4279 domain-containing protein [Leptospiraceae bacterium]HMW03874.1 DUF4279 domain-containing protein [Leptospiraceae bacterium]HMX34442.1 DUF4279 domain-containing protein [Leptospiraceae bacterium]HMY29854.1 DUF4279 domain-containing protein [Leptospiraceae bacterium]HMZ63002.1 DUF4279 domain-containing protein [Leptospiraceae bacterium]